MKIQCPSGEIKDIEDCLKCKKCYPFPVKKVLLEGRDRKRKNREKPRFGVTRLVSECIRRSYFELTEEVPISLEKLWIFSRGHAIHNFFQKSMKSENVEVFKKKEFGIFDVIGFIDAIEDGVLYEFKTTANIPQIPQEHHVLQAQAYFSLLSPEEQEEIKEIRIIYFSLNNIASFTIPKRNILPLLEAKGTILAQALKTAKPPKKKISWLCDLCEYKEFCTGEKALTYSSESSEAENKEPEKQASEEEQEQENEEQHIEIEDKQPIQAKGLQQFF